MVKYYSPQVEPLKNGKFKYSIRYTDPSFVGVKKSSTTMTKDTTHSRKLADEVVKKKTPRWAWWLLAIDVCLLVGFILKLKSKFRL